jgi:transcriptional regulator NrdR family protein
VSTEPSLTILKRTPGTSEPYNERKLFASIKAVCLSAHRPDGEADDTASRICKDLRPWLNAKQEITSLDIRAHAYRQLLTLSPKAAAIYKRRRRIMA